MSTMTESGDFGASMAEFIFDASKVDVVGLSPAGDVVLLYIAQPEPWSGSDGQLMSLQHKIHNYVSYALDGPMQQHYPETKDLPWRIVVDSQAGPPDERTHTVLSDVCQRLQAHGGDLTF